MAGPRFPPPGHRRDSSAGAGRAGSVSWLTPVQSLPGCSPRSREQSAAPHGRTQAHTANRRTRSRLRRCFAHLVGLVALTAPGDCWCLLSRQALYIPPGEQPVAVDGRLGVRSAEDAVVPAAEIHWPHHMLSSFLGRFALRCTTLLPVTRSHLSQQTVRAVPGSQKNALEEIPLYHKCATSGVPQASHQSRMAALAFSLQISAWRATLALVQS